ncbi:MAG: capsular biosynthesis protein, partial [Sphingobacteriales bacterium]
MDSQTYQARRTSGDVARQLWTKYFPYWPLFVLLLSLAFGGAWLYLRYKVPVFESMATLLIKDEKKGIEDSKMLESLNPLSSKKIIENEIEVIKSRALMRQVVNKLQLYTPIYQEGKWKDISAYEFSPVKIEARDPDSLLEISKVKFTYNTENATVTFNNSTYKLEQWIKSPWGVLRFSLNNPIYKYSGQLYFSTIKPRRIVQSLIANLEINSAGKLSSVLNLRFKDEVPKRSEDILNNLIAAYESANITDKNSLVTSTLSFLDDRLKYVSKDLDSIEKQLQHYRTKKGAIDISSQGQLFLQNVSENDQKLSDVNMKLAVLEQVEQYVSSNNTRGGLVPSTLGINDPLLTELLNKLYNFELQYEKLRYTTGENSPELKSITDQIQKIRPSILENVRSQQRSLQANKANLYSTNNSYTSLLKTLPQQERDLVEINREQSIKSSIYSFLLQKREETALSHSATVSDSRVIDRAESSLYPVGLGEKIVYCIAGVLALGLGVLLITVRELFTQTVLFRKEIEAVTSFPVIGEIAYEKSNSQIVIEEGKSSLIAEEFRLLRTSLN